MVKINEYVLYVENVNSDCFRLKRRKNTIIKNNKSGYGQLHNKKERWNKRKAVKCKDPPKHQILIKKSLNSEKPKFNLEKEINLEVTGNVDEWIDYKLNNLEPVKTTFNINIPEINERKREIINDLRFYQINQKDVETIYNIFEENINYKKLGQLYYDFKKEYRLVEIAAVLELFKNNIDKVRYSIAINMNQDTKETLYKTALEVKKEKCSRRNKKLKEDPKELHELSEMKTGKVSKEGYNIMKYFHREIRDDEKRVNLEKDKFNLEKELRDHGMSIIHL